MKRALGVRRARPPPGPPPRGKGQSQELRGIRVGKSAILVLGMHRSGTSALTRIINLMGATAPRTLLPATPENARGYWESAVLSALNEEILNACGTSWHSPRAPRADVVRTARRKGLDRRLRAAIESEFAGGELIVLKDPRVSRLVGLYQPVLTDLGYRIQPIIALRNPSEVVASTMKRDHFDLRKAERLWLRYTLDAERATRGDPRAIISYDALIADWRVAMATLGRHLGIAWPPLSAEAEAEADGFISSSLRHHALAPPAGGLGRKRLVADVYAAMAALARDPDDRPAIARLKRAALWFHLT